MPAEDGEVCIGDGFPDEWLSAWNLETHMSQKMVIEAKRKEIVGFGRERRWRCIVLSPRNPWNMDVEVKMISIKWVVANEGTEEHPVAKARNVARKFNTGDKRGGLFAGTPGLMAMREVISRAMTKCEDGAKRSIMLADVKTAIFCMATRGGRCTLSCHRRTPCQLLVDTWENLNVS